MRSDLENASDFTYGNSRGAVRVFERYSMIGGNRFSLTITLLQADGLLNLNAIASGDSQAILFKLNVFGEEAFLDVIDPIIKRFQIS